MENMKQKILYPELSYKINGLLFKTHNDLGRFCREKQYCDHFEKLLKESGLKYKREYEIKDFDNSSPDGNKVDFLIEDKIIVEAKSKKFILKDDYNQTQRYIQCAGIELGLIVNFRDTYLKPKRVLNKKKYSEHSDTIRKLGSDRGFTLIEMLIYIALIGVVIGGFVAFTFSISDSRNKNYVVQEVQANARTALNLISQKILAANGINTGSSTFDSDPGVLSLSMADASKNPTIINLTADNSQLQIKEGAGDTVVITSDEVKVTNLVFTDLTSTSDKENIRIEITVEFNNQGTDIKYNYEQSLQTSVSLRQ